MGMEIGVVIPGEPGVFASLLLPETVQQLQAGEPVTALGLTEGRLAVGAAAGYLVGQMFQVTSLYVAPDYRRQGGGRRLLEGLQQLTRGQADGLEIRFTADKEEQQALLPFLERMGFTRQDNHGETLFRTTLGEIAQVPFFAKGGAGHATPFSKLGESQLLDVEHVAAAVDAPVPVGGLRSKKVDRDISMAVLSDGAVQAYVVGDTVWSGGLRLSALWSRSKDAGVLPGLLRAALKRAVEKYPPETALIVQTVNQSSAALLAGLLPGAAPISHTYVYRFVR